MVKRFEDELVLPFSFVTGIRVNFFSRGASSSSSMGEKDQRSNNKKINTFEFEKLDSARSIIVNN